MFITEKHTFFWMILHDLKPSKLKPPRGRFALLDSQQILAPTSCSDARALLLKKHPAIYYYIHMYIHTCTNIYYMYIYIHIYIYIYHYM